MFNGVNETKWRQAKESKGIHKSSESNWNEKEIQQQQQKLKNATT